MTDPSFGDFEPDDAFDHEPPDPDQVARRLHRWRQLVAELIGAQLGDFDNLAPDERQRLLAVGDMIVEWLATHADHHPEPLARAVHQYRETQLPDLTPWDRLSDDEQAIAVELMLLLIAWLRRQGATA